ncbi:MAG: hypothetical protein WBQ57_03050 [Rhodanobacteraceae bacterium]
MIGFPNRRDSRGAHSRIAGASAADEHGCHAVAVLFTAGRFEHKVQKLPSAWRALRRLCGMDSAYCFGSNSAPIGSQGFVEANDTTTD